MDNTGPYLTIKTHDYQPEENQMETQDIGFNEMDDNEELFQDDYHFQGDDDDQMFDEDNHFQEDDEDTRITAGLNPEPFINILQIESSNVKTEKANTYNSWVDEAKE